MGFLAPKRHTYRYTSIEEVPKLAWQDIWNGLFSFHLWWGFAIHDIKQRFRRSLLGPFWLTISMGCFTAALGFVMSTVFRQDIDIFLPYLATGIIFWTLLTTIITECCYSFISSEGYIKNVPMPLSTHFYRVVARNVIIWLHNMIIYLVVFAVYLKSLNVYYLIFFPAMIVFIANVLWLSLVLAILSTRYRDVPQVVSSIIPVVFIVTPIFWTVDVFPSRPAFIDLNPFYHLIELVRAPLLGQMPHELSWFFAIALLIVGFPITFYIFKRSYPRIPFWV